MFTQKEFTHKEVIVTSDLLSEDTESGRYYILKDGNKLPSGEQTIPKKQHGLLEEAIKYTRY